MPTEASVGLRRRALEAVEATVDPDVVVGFRYSPLGPEWSSDIDIHVLAMPDDATLRGAGWYDLSGLLGRVGRQGEGRWAITDAGAVLGSADFEITPLPDPLLSALQRNAKGASLRTVLELRALQRSGSVLPTDGSLIEAAELERRLGGDELPTDGRSVSGRISAIARVVRSAAPRPPRNGAAISISGVDGAGKSTLIERLTAELVLAGVPFTQIWARPGYDLGVFDSVATSVKRLLRKQPEPGIRAVVSDGDDVPESRTGLSAAVWRIILVGEYLAKMRRRAALADGLTVFDRYAVDAEVTLAFAYGLERPWVGRLLRRVLRAPDVQIFLTIDAETALQRKPDDPMGRSAIADQLERYRRSVPDYPGIREIDGTTPLDEIIAGLWELLCSEPIAAL